MSDSLKEMIVLFIAFFKHVQFFSKSAHKFEPCYRSRVSNKNYLHLLCLAPIYHLSETLQMKY